MRSKPVVNEKDNEYINLNIASSPKQNAAIEEDLYEYVAESDPCSSKATKTSEKNDEKTTTVAMKPTGARLVIKWKVGTIVTTTTAIAFIVAFVVVLYRQNISETPCDEIVCNNNGTCVMVNLQPVCLCRYGYQGTHCEESTCMNHVCQNGGTCIDKDKEPMCLCKYRFYGERCQYAFESCVSFVEDDSDQTMCLELQQDKTDDYDWAIHSGPTSSSGTGPASAVYGRYYHYFETSSPVKTGEKARLLFNASESYSCLRFWYHMYGAGMGSLSVLFNQSSIWSISGDQNNTWHPAQINLPNSSFTQVIFEAVRGSDFTSDIAIDGVRVTRSQC